MKGGFNIQQLITPFFVLILILTIYNNDVGVYGKVSSTKSTGSSSSSSSKTINAFLIPHSHCDVGWVQTYEQYFTENVTVILNNVVNALLKDPSKKFNWAEIIYFKRWWDEQTDFTQSQVRQLVQNKQLEFVGGGWAQNDEAVTHYQAVLNQMTIGHQFLLGTFGVVPECGWQIDPFGPSTITAMLFKLMGFKYHIINRVDERIKYVFNTTPDIEGSGSLITDRSFEFMWYPSPSYGKSLSLFTHILDDHYNSPQICYPNATNPNITICTGFDFESDPSSNPPINSSNIAERAEILVGIIKERVLYYRHNNMLLPFGNDFRFQDSNLEFDNMDQLIEYINANSSFNVNIRYATLSEYFEAVEAETQPTDFPDINGEDYYTYTMCLGVDYQNFNTCVNYWSGYFSSYPLLKQTIRNSDTYLRHIETLYSLASATPSSKFTFNSQAIFQALALHRNVSGILTHHDAVTGTAKEYVRNDYFNMLWSAQNASLDVIPSMISYLLANESIEYGFDYQDALLKGMTIGQVVVVSLSNSVAWNRVEYVHFPVGVQNYAVYDFNQQPITSQIIQRFDKDNEWELYFEATVPALGISTYFIMCIGNSNDQQYNYVPNSNDLEYPIPSYVSKPIEIRPTEDLDVVIGNTQFELHFQPNPDNNYLLELKYYVDLNHNGNRIELNQQLVEYDSMTDDCYKFRTHGYAHPLDATAAQFYLTEGPIASMVTVIYRNNVTQLFTVYNTTSMQSGSGAQEDQYFEIENVVSVGFDHEISMRFNSSIDNGKVFYTNNGLETIERVWTEKYNDSHVWSLIAGNFYPTINTGFITDENSELVVLNRQSMGASSQANGLLEFLLIRRSNYTQWSIHETMNDTSSPRIRSRILVGQPNTVELRRTPHSILHENELLKMFAPVKGNSIREWCRQMQTQYLPLKGDQFPQNLHLLTLNRQWDDNQEVLMRLINIYEIGQSNIYSKPLTVTFQEIFTQFNISSVLETTLTANAITNATLPIAITLNPIEIKTFTMSFNSLQQSESNQQNDNELNQIIIN
ncbi:alpha-mannosidase [Heterostelium album PN500]|uniref:Alpha-mannosidase n=1 Tax=Heterostelium pallidum (strain ATCC 26659 / Pp 5 / PN500) TaxID=670386 RepID=D3B6P2_HETP5|nr:alpha-mannosidase [Heterostelium album PN500]EFA83012.1 alpha-mannosidase [Heterostelium album PN500]|eukprot:XP_020435129.1 alpha-mannosidase [Heterostelium album PN500]